MASINLINHRQNCRMCLNSFRKLESTIEITETIKNQFYELTNFSVRIFFISIYHLIKLVLVAPLIR